MNELQQTQRRGNMGTADQHARYIRELPLDGMRNFAERILASVTNRVENVLSVSDVTGRLTCIVFHYPFL